MKDSFKEPGEKKLESPDASLAGTPEKPARPPRKRPAFFVPDSISGLTVILFIITLAAALLLGTVHRFTAPVIEQTEARRRDEAMRRVIGADSFAKTSLDGLYEARAGGRLVGFCVLASPRGHVAAINVMVGVDLEGRVSGAEVVSHSETPGLGSQATGPDFLIQFVGKDASAPLGGEIDAVTGATVTSEAVTSGIREAVGKVFEYLNGEGEENG